MAITEAHVNLRSFLERNGISQSTFAQRAKMSQSSLSRVLAGRGVTAAKAVWIETITFGCVAAVAWGRPAPEEPASAVA